MTTNIIVHASKPVYNIQFVSEKNKEIMENTKVLYQVGRSRPVSFQTAAKVLKQFQARIQQDSTSFTSSFNVPSDIADKLMIVGEELEKLVGNSTQIDQPKKDHKKHQHSSQKKKRSADEVLASQDDEEDKAVAVAIDDEISKPLKKKQKKSHKEYSH